MDENYLLTITFISHSSSSNLQIAELRDVLTTDRKMSCKTSRAVERGAMLIGHEADGTRVWLQMPRGPKLFCFILVICREMNIFLLVAYVCSFFHIQNY